MIKLRFADTAASQNLESWERKGNLPYRDFCPGWDLLQVQEVILLAA